ncbi:MAG: hypothetical protein GPJ17_13020 [Microcystis aeruginosa K13-07]|nr:hypothetical protein [Microcystis aeruginosa K13-07]
MTLVKLIDFAGGGNKNLLGVAIASSVLAVSTFVIVPVQAAIININSVSNDTGNPIVQFFSAGDYQVDYIGVADGGMYDAWNAWGTVQGCDANGANCQNGWVNNYSISSSEFSISQGTGTYATPALALANGQNTAFTLTGDSNVYLFIGDSFYSDNIGGVSLKVMPISNPPVTSVPETSSILGLLSLGVLGIGAALNRKL